MVPGCVGRRGRGCGRASLGWVEVTRLEADGLLTSEQRVVDGRARRVYRATEAGRQALADDRAALTELAREILGWNA
jgi:DNA-binding PadR family transcriptional regulator